MKDYTNYRETYIARDRVLTYRDYQSALDVQNACNLSGVVIAYAEVMRKICEEDWRSKRGGTEWRNRHPISILYASKVLSLATGEITDTYIYGLADDIAQEKAKPPQIHIRLNEPTTEQIVAGACPHCGRLDTWLDGNAMPLTAFCVGTEDEPHIKWERQVPEPFNCHLPNYRPDAKVPEIEYEDRRPLHDDLPVWDLT